MADSISKYKVAVASTDGETVNQHYGRCEKFYIYSVDDEVGYDLTEERIVKPVCQDGSHNKEAMAESVKAFLDCRYIIVSRLGSAPASLLAANKITVMELPGSIDDAILSVWKFNRIQGLFS